MKLTQSIQKSMQKIEKKERKHQTAPSSEITIVNVVIYDLLRCRSSRLRAMTVSFQKTGS